VATNTRDEAEHAETERLKVAGSGTTCQVPGDRVVPFSSP
jgi:hypothetical protein